MRRMCTLITTQVFGVHGGRITNGDTSAVSKQYGTVIALVQPELRQLKLQQI
jgi:hypothetical protein